MKRVTGIGGIFFKARDPAALRAWYQRHLGIDVQPWGGTAFTWTDDAWRGRSLAETGMCRYKTIIGPGLRARTVDNQKAEAAIGVRCLNRFTALGMPRSFRIA